MKSPLSLRRLEEYVARGDHYCLPAAFTMLAEGKLTKEVKPFVNEPVDGIVASVYGDQGTLTVTPIEGTQSEVLVTLTLPEYPGSPMISDQIPYWDPPSGGLEYLPQRIDNQIASMLAVTNRELTLDNVTARKGQPQIWTGRLAVGLPRGAR